MDSTVVDSYDGLLFTAVAEPAKPLPEIDTLPATNITHNSATLSAELIEAGYCSNNYCYIEWGKTTGYGYKSSETRLYPGQGLEVDGSGMGQNNNY